MDGSALRFGQYRPAQRTVLHLSDTHLLAGDRKLAERIDTTSNLRSAIASVRALEISPDAIVVTGDLTDLGEPEAYRRLRGELEPLAEELDAPLIWVAGNHDERGAMREGLFDLDPSEEPVTGVWDLDGLRLIALDSTVPGWHHGDLDDRQLAWLGELLAEPAPLGTLLAMHHPPLPSHVPLFDILELRNQERLAAVIAGSDVRGILAGHLHYSTSGTFVGVPVSVASATCYAMDLAHPPLHVNGADAGQAFHLVLVYDDTVTHSVVPVLPGAGRAAQGVFSPEWYAQMAALSPQERLERFSRKPSR